MKKTFIFILLTILIFSSCIEKPGKNFNAYFCTRTKSAEKIYLFIDEKNKGELNSTGFISSCDELPAGENALYTSLPSGNHIIEAKDAHGNIVFSEKLRIKHRKKGSSVSSSINNDRWGTRVKANGDCLVIELIY